MTTSIPQRRRTDLAEENARLSAELQISRAEISALLRQATTDELTGLLNRRGFLRLADHELRCAHARQCPLTLIYVDVDGLKALNDGEGHEAGDALLVETAELLRAAFRDTDVVGRLGGDEFGVLTRGFHGDADVVRRRIAQVGAALRAAGVQRHDISLSAGVTLINPQDESALADLIDRADQAMYAVKRAKPQPRHLHAVPRRALAAVPLAV